MSEDFQNPEDWDEPGAWEREYLRFLDQESETEGDLFGAEVALRFVPSFLEADVSRIWFPGCGLSLGPQVYAALGFDVLATDIAESAIEYQQRPHQSVPEWELGKEKSSQGRVQI